LNTELIDEQDTDFSSNLLVNTRTIASLADVLHRSERGAGGAISLSEFANLITVLEALATSGRVIYDGTVPQRENEKMMEVHDHLADRVGRTDTISAVAPETVNETTRLCREGARQSCLLIKTRLDGLFASSGTVTKPDDVTPLEGEAPRKFADAFLKAPLDHETVEEVARTLVASNPFNGAKCAAGIMLLNNTEDERTVRDYCRQVLQNSSDADLTILVPTLINAFRASYLNEVGALDQAAFFAGPEIDQVKSQQILLLSSYVGSRLGKEKLSEVVTYVNGEERARDKSFPFIGLMIFLSGTQRDPYSIVNEALADRDELQAAFSMMAAKSGKKRYIHDMDAHQLYAFKEEKLDRLYRGLHRKLRAYDWWTRVNQKYLEPAFALLPAINETFSQIQSTVEMNDAVVGEVSGGRLQFLIDKLVLSKGDAFYSTFTHRIRNRLGGILSDVDGETLIKERVEQVLGLELVKQHPAAS
jgi:hypothetical protein